MKRVFIVHGWGGKPDETWFPWLATQLRNKGFRVEILEMPDTDNPRIDTWVPALSKAVGTPDQETYFVGHSIGCQTILRYFETITEKVGGAVLVAPFYTLNLDETEDASIAKPWIESPMNDVHILAVCEHIRCIFSDNDKYVPLSNSEEFKKRLNAHVTMEHAKGHMGSSDNVPELPSALNAILFLTK